MITRPVQKLQEAIAGRASFGTATLGLPLALLLASQAHAADVSEMQTGGVEPFGLVDVATGLPASGKAPAYEGEQLAYPAESEAPSNIRILGSGIASYYGDAFAGRLTASGEIFDPDGLTAAHRTLPFGSKVLVTSELTGQSVVVTINDRGPWHGNRIIDLSEAAASRIGLIRPGSGPVSLALLAQ